MRFVRALAAATLLAAGLLTAPGAAPLPVAGIGSLPECKLEDILTIPRGYDDWATTLVDWNLSLGPDYKPPDLVSVRKGGVGGGGLVRKVVIADLLAMATAARKNGTPLVAWSPYRSYKTQVDLFNSYVRGYGYDSAVNFSARPGHSEHQLGLAIDFVAVGDKGLTSNWEVTRTGKWMANNAWKYGWLMSFPKGKQDVVCYSYEPWHYRYVGRDLAKKIHDSGLTPREYLWANFTQLDSSFQPVATATIEPTTAPSPTTEPVVPTEPPSTVAAATAGSTATTAPTASAGAWFGFDPVVVVVAALLVLAAIGLVVSRRWARRSRPG